MTHNETHPFTAHLPRLSDERIAQMTAYASSFPQEPTDLPLVQRVMNGLYAFFSADAYRNYRRAGATVMAVACLTLFLSMPVTTTVPTVKAPHSGMTMAKATTLQQQEHDISEYLIRDFLDEMV